MAPVKRILIFIQGIIMTAENDKTRIASIKNKNAVSKESKLHLIGKYLAKRYLIEELIGEGGMGYIYRARDTYLNNNSNQDDIVAIKVLHPELADSEDALMLLKDETIKTRSLSHPNIVKVFSASSSDNYHFVVMEWIEGETLEQLIKRNKPSGLSQKRAKPILNQLIDALTYAHTKGIVHSDLKPSNIILDSQGNLKILDFGIAKTNLHEDKYAAPDNNELPNSNGYTPTYASPEQLNGDKPSAKDDIFAFGCIAFELLTSKHPYNRVAANQVAKETSVKKPSNCSLSVWLKLKKCLSLDAAMRPKSLLEVRSELNKNRTSLVIHAACYTLLLGAAGYQFLSQSDKQQLIEANYQNSLAKVEQLETWMNWPSDGLPQRLNEIPPQYQVLKEGLLAVHQSKVVEKFTKQVDDLPRTAINTRAYDDAIDIYDEAKKIYPDSETVNTKLESLLTERQSILSDLSYRLDVLLSQSRYDESGDNNIHGLVSQLKIIDASYSYVPNQEHINNFKLAVLTSIENEDFVTQKTLLDVGELVFSNTSELEPLVTALRKKESAMVALAEYKRKTSEGKTVSYPGDDAKIFYQEKLERFNTQLASVSDYKQLMEFDESFSKEAEIFPESFEPILLIKDQIATTYISMASSLMKQKMYRTAERLVERSEEIRKSLENTI